MMENGSEDDKPNLNVPIIWVLGGPGSGKGTQCELIVQRYGFCHLSSGDLLRAEVRSGSPRGKELADVMASGGLVPMNIVLALLKEAILKCHKPSGFLIDGYPREKVQGIQFENSIAYVDYVLFFDATEETLTARLLSRGKSSGRADDNAETIKNRLVTFKTYNDELIQHYEEKLKKINAEREPQEIFEEVVLILDPLVEQYKEKATALAQ